MAFIRLGAALVGLDFFDVKVSIFRISLQFSYKYGDLHTKL